VRAATADQAQKGWGAARQDAPCQAAGKSPKKSCHAASPKCAPQGHKCVAEHHAI
jgi:hypothetical protein